jgi:glutathione S-transferase
LPLAADVGGHEGVMATPQVTLWHLPVSHYSEKVRWALQFKGVEHRRRVGVAGAHMGVALWLTKGRHVTFPVIRTASRSPA